MINSAGTRRYGKELKYYLLKENIITKPEIDEKMIQNRKAWFSNKNGMVSVRYDLHTLRQIDRHKLKDKTINTQNRENERQRNNEKRLWDQIKRCSCIQVSVECAWDHVVDQTYVVKAHKHNKIVWKIELVHHLSLQEQKRNTTKVN